MTLDLAREPLTSQVHRAIIALIDAEGLLPGHGLPSTAALSERFGVSRPVVREALSSLAAIGLIEVANGRNAVVRPLDDRLISLFLSRAIRTTAQPLTALMELRAPLEVEAASLAARRADAEARRELTELEAELTAAVDDGEAYVRLDLALHRRIAILSGNPALLGVTEAVRAQVFEVMTRLREHRESRNIEGHEHEEHQRVIAAIVDGDQARAAAAMREHMVSTEALVADLEGQPV